MENMRNITGTSMWAVERLGNSNSLDEKLETLTRKLEQLSSRQMDVNTEVEYSELQGKKRRREVENWSINVGMVENKVQGIEQEVQESTVFSRAFKLGNQVEKLSGEVAKLIDQGKFSQGLTLDMLETKGNPLLTTKLVGQAFQKNLDNIWESLMKVDVLSIGIHGMGGAGKTTMAMHIHNQLLEKPNSFNVCWVSVSQDFSIRKVQNEIAKTIKLDLSNEDDEKKRAAKLAQALKRMKLVLILDDVWKCFSLQEVGICVKVNGCKLILTTRFSDVCRKMGCQENVRVVPLNEEEAWNLFMEKFGHDIELPLEVKEIARSIAKECAGLPLGIITVARSMRGMDINIHGWRNTLEELKLSKPGLDEMEEDVFRVLKFSYNNLKDPKLQECFLYCSLYPEDFNIKRDELIELLIDEGIIERRRSKQAEFDMGHSMLNKLENAYLLEGFEDMDKDKCVKMHDLLRDMAIQIGRASHGFMVAAGKGLNDLPSEDQWKDDLLKVSLMSCSFLESIFSKTDVFYDSPRCPKLATLLLSHINFRGGIPNSFFVHMLGLKVLNLSYTVIKELPDSISNLVNLTALLLKGCQELKHVPSLAKLTALRRLDLENTGIIEIPQGLEMLVNLRYLDLHCSYLEIFPTGILPKLSHLQYLVFYLNSKTLKVKGEEVAYLKKLEIFRGQLYDIHDLNTCVRSLEEEEKRPNYYLLQVGVHIYDMAQDFVSIKNKTVILSNCSIRNSRGGEDLLVLPKDVQSLQLFEIGDLRSLCDVPSFNNAADLNTLFLLRCEGIDHILSSSLYSSCILPLQSVESVQFIGLHNLRVLIKEERAGSSPTPPGIFSRLKVFTMFRCGNIKKLFMPELLLHLHNLEEIDITNCEELVEIIGASSDEVEVEDDDDNEERNKGEIMGTTIFSLPKLRLLKLCFLTELKSICSSSSQFLVCDSIQEIKILGCPKLKRLHLSLPLIDEQLCPPPSLNKIEAFKKWWESLEWDHPNSKTVLEPFCCLY